MTMTSSTVTSALTTLAGVVPRGTGTGTGSQTGDNTESVTGTGNATTSGSYVIVVVGPGGDRANYSPPSSSEDPDEDVELAPFAGLPEVAIIGSLVSLVIVGIVVGNAFVVASVTVFREMRTLTNWMIVSLASADLLVAVAVLPLSAYQEVVGGHWRLGRILCDFWTTADVFCCTASILNIAAIALDRYWLITRNVAYTHAHRLPRRQACRLMAVLAWLTAGVISAAPLLGLSTGLDNDTDAGVCRISQHYAYTIFSTFGAFWLPLSVIVVVYGRIFWIAQRRLHKRMRQRLAALPIASRTAATDLQQPQPQQQQRLSQQTLDQPPPETPENCVRTTGPTVIVGSTSPFLPLAVLRLTPSTTTVVNNNPEVAGLRPPPAVPPTLSTSLLCRPAASDYLRGPPSSCCPTSGAAVGSAGATSARNGSASTRQQRRLAIAAVDSAAAAGNNSMVSYRKCQYRRMRNSARMLGLIIGGFVLCWLPFFLLATAVPFFGDSLNVPGPVASICNWLGYVNSLLNPIIYAIWDRNFRRCFRRLASCDVTSRPPMQTAAAGTARGADVRRSEPM